MLSVVFPASPPFSTWTLSQSFSVSAQHIFLEWFPELLMKKGSFQPLLVSFSLLPRPSAGLLATPLSPFLQSLEPALSCNTWDRISISTEIQKGLSKPMNPEIQACHLSRAGLEDKEGSCLLSLCSWLPFSTGCKVSRCFVLAREDPRLLCIAEAEEKEAPFSWGHCPCPSSPQYLPGPVSTGPKGV